MTPFQRECLSRLGELYEELRIAPSEEVTETKEDDTLAAKDGDVFVRQAFERGGIEFQVFVYSDEAGYFLEKQWIPFEAVGYFSPQELIEALLKNLRSEIVYRSRKAEK